MRGGRSLLVLLVVALGLGAYIYFVESERDPAGTEAREQAFDVEQGDISSLTIRGTSADTTTLSKTDETWAVTSPVTTPADSTTVDSIVSSLATMEINRVVEEAPANLAQYGLEEPRVDVSFTTTGGATHRLALGNTTPTNSGLYARIDDNPRLVLVPSYLESTFDKSTFDLRNRRALDIARDAVDRISITPRSGTAIELRRDGVNWRLTAPIDARADFSPADSILSRLSTAQMSSIVSEGSEPTAADLRQWGLDSPRLTATLGSGSTTATLALGAARDDASIYARDLSRPIVFTVDASLLTDLQKEPADLRVRDVFAFNAFSARSIEVTHDSTTVAWAKSTPAEGAAPDAQSTWSRTKPDAGDVNQTALTDLLNALSGLRAGRFVAQPPAGGETIDVTVQFGTSGAPTTEQVTLRRSSGTAYALKDGEPGAAVLPEGEFDAVLGHWKTLTSPPAAAPTAEAPAGQ